MSMKKTEIHRTQAAKIWQLAIDAAAQLAEEKGCQVVARVATDSAGLPSIPQKNNLPFCPRRIGSICLFRLCHLCRCYKLDTNLKKCH